MKQILIILFAFSLSIGYAQEQKKDSEAKKETKEERQKRYIEEVNPFKELGYRPRIATLSNGKYREVFPDTIVQVGSFTFNILSKQLTGVTVIEKSNLSEADLRPELVSRWMSPDPLASEFPEWSPYNFVKNSPLIYVDPTGLAPETVLDDYGLDSDGNITLLQKTNDNFDRLYAVDENGNKVDTNNDGNVNTSDSHKVNDKTILPSLANNTASETSWSDKNVRLEGHYAISGNHKEVKNLYKWIGAQNSNEWTYIKADTEFGTKSFIGTLHQSDQSLTPSRAGFGDYTILEHSHTHFGTSLDDFQPSGLDMKGAANARLINPNAKFTIYSPLITKENYNKAIKGKFRTFGVPYKPINYEPSKFIPY